MPEQIRPVGGKLLLSIVDGEEEVIDGGIILTKGQKRESIREAVVQALPNGYKGDLSVGDTVYVKPWTGVETLRGKQRLLFIKENELIAAAEG